MKPGQLCAIMGARYKKNFNCKKFIKLNIKNNKSGAGKTTLLNVLNFRNQKKMIIDGEVKLNGQPADWKIISKCSGYVQQDDLFIGTMTVREHLSFLVTINELYLFYFV